jgi:ribosome biogenesis GTPase
VVILTKADLAADPAAIVDEVAEASPGAPVYAVSASRGTGLDPLRDLVTHGRTLALIGSSGSGKSTLVNALAGTTVMETQAIRRSDGRGRHTTTFRALVPLASGGSVIDTPGIRAVGLVDGLSGLAQTFADIDAIARLCRFQDCTHRAEPGCAVIDALATGELTPRRMQSWRKLQQEITHEMGRRAARRRMRRTQP